MKNKEFYKEELKELMKKRVAIDLTGKPCDCKVVLNCPTCKRCINQACSDQYFIDWLEEDNIHYEKISNIAVRSLLEVFYQLGIRFVALDHEGCKLSLMSFHYEVKECKYDNLAYKVVDRTVLDGVRGRYFKLVMSQEELMLECIE